MFGPDFYPTPHAVAKTMLNKISDEAVHFLEPSAGKGDLAKAIVQARSTRSSFSRMAAGSAMADSISGVPETPE